MFQAIDKSQWPEFLTQMRGMLKDHGRLVIRNTTQELIRGIFYYRYFPTGRADVMSRLPSFSNIWTFLIEARFKPVTAVLVNDATPMSFDEMYERLRVKPYTWCERILPQDFEQGLDRLRRAHGHQPGQVEWHQPAWLIVAERDG